MVIAEGTTLIKVLSVSRPSVAPSLKPWQIEAALIVRAGDKGKFEIGCGGTTTTQCTYTHTPPLFGPCGCPAVPAVVLRCWVAWPRLVHNITQHFLLGMRYFQLIREAQHLWSLSFYGCVIFVWFVVAANRSITISVAHCSGVSNPAPVWPPSCRVYLQPASAHLHGRF